MIRGLAIRPSSSSWNVVNQRIVGQSIMAMSTSTPNHSFFEAKKAKKRTKSTKLAVETPDAAARFAKGPFGWVQRQLFRVEVNPNYDHRAWAWHKSPWRHLRSWMPGHLTDLRRLLFPDLAQVGAIAAGVTWYNQTVAAEVLKILDTDGDGDVSNAELRAGIESGLIEANHVMGQDFFTNSDMLLLATTPFTLTAIALGMLLAFRNQNCFARYHEARLLFGALTNESRALSSRVMALVPPDEQDPKRVKPALARQASLDAVKCVMMFSRTLKYHVTVDGFHPNLEFPPGCSEEEMEKMKTAALKEELGTIWDYNDPRELAFVDRLLSSDVQNRPLHVLQELTEITGGVLARPIEEGGGGLHAVQTQDIFRSITRFQDILGGCERIYKTPIYGGYTKFTSRCVSLWTNLLPLSLYPIMGPVGTVPTSLVVASFLYGLDDVGATIEEPFSCLPLGQLCDGIDGVCRQMMQQRVAITQSRLEPEECGELFKPN